MSKWCLSDVTTFLPRLLLMLPPLFAGSALAAPLTFQRAVELAARHSVGPSIVSADLERTYESYVESKSLYLPQMVAGSATGYSAGLPLTLDGAAPSIFNVAARQILFNPAQRSFMKSARAQWQASTLAESFSLAASLTRDQFRGAVAPAAARDRHASGVYRNRTNQGQPG